MASTFTSNLGVEKPGAGDYVGTWDSPVNSDFDVFDQAAGTIQAIDLSGGSVILSTTQIRSANLKFIGALPSNVTVTVSALSSAPGTTISGRSWIMQSQCSNSSAYTITVASTVAGQKTICMPHYNPMSILLEGTNSSEAGSVKFANLPMVGTFWDFIGSSVPNWVSGCTVPPYLNCDGTSFSSATYPALATILGGTTLPDSRGRFRATLNQSQSRITSGSSTGGVDGNTNLSAGGAQTTTLSSQNMPSILITDPGHNHPTSSGASYVTNASSVASISITGGGAALGISSARTATTGITAGSTSPTNFSNIPPAYIGGLTLVRSA
jgi:hypothetical protein